MATQNRKTWISKRRLRKIESSILSRKIPLPIELQEWWNDISQDEIRAALAYHSIQVNERPDDLQNPYDEFCSRLPTNGIALAHESSERFRFYSKLGMDTRPVWFHIIQIILDYEHRCALGIAEALPAGAPPLRWQDYTTQRPYARQAGCQEPLKLKKNYRRKGSKTRK